METQEWLTGVVTTQQCIRKGSCRWAAAAIEEANFNENHYVIGESWQGRHFSEGASHSVSLGDHQIQHQAGESCLCEQNADVNLKVKHSGTRFGSVFQYKSVLIKRQV